MSACAPVRRLCVERFARRQNGYPLRRLGNESDPRREPHMPSIKGTKTELNLLKAFAGESQARNRYTYFASVANKEGFEQISALFLETADNEKEHAQIFFDYLKGGNVEITASYPAGKTGNTQENLLEAANGEK